MGTGKESEGQQDNLFRFILRSSLQVPRVLGARRPTLVVPGLEYGLGEGEGVMLETDAEKREIHLANMENYALNSFVCDTGYLSEEEMVETPCVNRAVTRIKQKRKVKKVKVGQTNCH